MVSFGFESCRTSLIHFQFLYLIPFCMDSTLWPNIQGWSAPSSCKPLFLFLGCQFWGYVSGSRACCWTFFTILSIWGFQSRLFDRSTPRYLEVVSACNWCPFSLYDSMSGSLEVARFVAGRPFNPHKSDIVSSIVSSLQCSKCRWRSKMSHANFKGGFRNFKIWIKRRVLLPISCQMTFWKSSAFLREGESTIRIKYT